MEKISASRDTLMPVKRKASEMVDTDEKPMQGKKMRKDGPIRNGAEKGDRRGGKVGSNGKEKSDQRREKRDKGQKGEPNTKPEPMKETATRKVEGEREKVGLEKLGAKMGSMIGRKRKMRRGGN